MKNTGKPFEKTIETILMQYASKGILRMKKVDPPTRLLKLGGSTKVIMLPNPFLDYVGSWTARHGRAVFMEAKSTSEPQLKINSDGGLTVKQFEAMRQWQAAGAVTFVLWEHHGHVRMLTYDMVKAALETAKHIKFPCAIPVPNGLGFVIYNFVEIMEKIWPAK